MPNEEKKKIELCMLIGVNNSVEYFVSLFISVAGPPPSAHNFHADDRFNQFLDYFQWISKRQHTIS